MELPRKKILRKEASLTVEIFLILMLIVIGIQGTYLGYMVGILTNLERRFGISSRRSGTLFSVYDVGHTVAVVLVGVLATNRNLPRITAIGVVTSAFSMFLLALPAAIFGTAPHEASLAHNRDQYIQENRCYGSREIQDRDTIIHCIRDKKEHTEAFRMLAFAQLVAGIAAAPFNTIAYVYIDDNLKNKNKSPFYLGLLSSMYAFGPAFGFALSAGLTRIHTTVFYAPPNLDINNEEWVGAWWLGLIICGFMYLFCSIPLFFFPKSLLHPDDDPNNVELHQLRDSHHEYENISKEIKPNDETEVKESCCRQLTAAAEEFLSLMYDLLKNPIFLSMVIGWMFASYLVGGYNTYLPKYVETQYARSASEADIYAGIISIGSVAVSTALGGYLLTRFNIPPRKAILFLVGSWTIVVISYLLGPIVGCDEPSIQELAYNEATNRIAFTDVHSCNWNCECSNVNHFDPVHYGKQNFFSPCHAGCKSYNLELNMWDQCLCADYNAVESGLYLEKCNQLYIYLIIMFIGLFFGNLFFMTTMMVVLRSVYDHQKVVALSFASCLTNILGFIPAPVLLGFVIDRTCLLWNNPKCYLDHGNCVIYNNKLFRHSYHFVNAGIQLLAVIAVIACYFISQSKKLPEEEKNESDEFDVIDQLQQQQQQQQQSFYQHQQPVDLNTSQRFHETDF